MKVKGYRLLVKPDEVETHSKGGIFLGLDQEMEKAGQQFGTVLGIGSTCWKGEEPWCVEGDKILFSKHAGRFVYDPETQENFMIMNDDDILAVL